MEYAKDCGVRAEHADTIGKKLLLFGKRLHTVNMPDIAHDQEQAFINALQKDDFNAILELKGYQPSENVLKNIQDIKPAQSPVTGDNKRSMELVD